MRPVEAEVNGRVSAPLESAWARFVPIDLTAIFKGLGPLPAVVSLTGQTGTWDRLGQSRHVGLSDGSTVKEEITEVALPEGAEAQFGYVVRGFSGLIGRLTGEARDSWQFRESDGETLIRWQYAFAPKGRAARLVLVAIIRPLWARYMRDALNRTERILAGGGAEGQTT